MIECMRLIIGEVGTRERERERGTEGRYIREIQNDLDGRERAAMLGDNEMEAKVLSPLSLKLLQWPLCRLFQPLL